MKWRQTRWGILLCLSGTAARAETQEYGADWHAPASCPTVDRLHAEVAERSLHLRPSSGGQRVRIDVVEDASGYFSASVGLPSGVVRQVKARDCADILSAAAFMLVMDLEPAAISGSDDDGPSPAPDREASLASARQWQSYVGATFGAGGGRTPELMPQGGLFYELWREGGLVSQGARASATFAVGELAPSPDRVSVRLSNLALDVCPIGISFASLCAGAELGAVHLRAAETLSSDQTLRLSVAGHVGLALRGVLGGRWLAEATAGVLLPITLHEFVVQRRDGSMQELHTVGIGGYGNLSVGYRL